MPNPDITQYTNLVIYDKDPQDIVDAALVTLQSRLPEWTPSETTIELADDGSFSGENGNLTTNLY